MVKRFQLITLTYFIPRGKGVVSLAADLSRHATWGDKERLRGRLGGGGAFYRWFSDADISPHFTQSTIRTLKQARMQNRCRSELK